MDLVNLSRAVSHALRHEPWLYELELDAEGWACVDELISALRSDNEAWSNLTKADLQQMITYAEKKRHEIRGDKIRAYYGHSIPQKLVLTQCRPPTFLYHGTSAEALRIIRTEGLKPMGRQYVHLSADVKTANKVGARKAKVPIILQINAEAAFAGGVSFYHGNQLVWLADAIQAAFIDIWEPH